jgi:hypothetical protein
VFHRVYTLAPMASILTIETNEFSKPSLASFINGPEMEQATRISIDRLDGPTKVYLLVPIGDVNCDTSSGGWTFTLLRTFL